MVYGAALLMRFGFIPIEGSNPSASAVVTDRNSITLSVDNFQKLPLQRARADPSADTAINQR